MPISSLHPDRALLRGSSAYRPAIGPTETACDRTLARYGDPIGDVAAGLHAHEFVGHDRRDPDRALGVQAYAIRGALPERRDRLRARAHRATCWRLPLENVPQHAVGAMQSQCG